MIFLPFILQKSSRYSCCWKLLPCFYRSRYEKCSKSFKIGGLWKSMWGRSGFLSRVCTYDLSDNVKASTLFVKNLSANKGFKHWLPAEMQNHFPWSNLTNKTRCVMLRNPWNFIFLFLFLFFFFWASKEWRWRWTTVTSCLCRVLLLYLLAFLRRYRFVDEEQILKGTSICQFYTSLKWHGIVGGDFTLFISETDMDKQTTENKVERKIITTIRPWAAWLRYYR